MNSENFSHNNDPFAEMDGLIQQQYLEIMRKRLELSKKRAAKDPTADDLQLVIDQMQEDYDGITKTHSSYMRAAKHFKNQGKGQATAETQAEFQKLITEMKSSTMGSIVTGIPKS